MIATVHAPAHRRRRTRRGSVVLIVLWAISLGAILVAAIQLSARRQTMSGIDAVERVRARWAARAGVERMIAHLAYHTEFPDPDDAFAVYRDLADHAYSEQEEIFLAHYAIEHYRDGQVYAGPIDEHSKFNINLAAENQNALLNIGMFQDQVDAIVDWIDEDDEITGQGAEAAYYLMNSFPYTPRNSFMRSIAEMELVAAIDPLYVREEDWNYNNLFDPNEDDGDLMEPRDNADRVLEQGWAKYLTATSVSGGLSPSGLPRLYLPDALPEEVMQRTGTSQIQAEALTWFGLNPDNSMSLLWINPVNFIREDGSFAPLDGQPANEALPLDANQMIAVFGELTMDDPNYRLPGKININTVPENVLTEMLDLDPAVTDEIIYYRERSPQGFRSLVELIGVSPNFTAPVMADITDVLDVTSNVFTVTSRGWSEKTGTEVQLIVVVDRSTLPVRILEYREQ